MFVDVCLFEFYPSRTKYAPYATKILFKPSNYGLQHTDFHEAKTCLTKLHADILYGTSPKSAKKYGKCGYSFPYVRCDYH